MEGGEVDEEGQEGVEVDVTAVFDFDPPGVILKVAAFLENADMGLFGRVVEFDQGVLIGWSIRVHGLGVMVVMLPPC